MLLAACSGDEPATVITAVRAATVAGGAAGPFPVRLVPRPWYPSAELMTDRAALGRELAALGYRATKRTYVLATRVVAGAGQPGFQYFGLGDTAYVYSPGVFWPASTIKPFAAARALMVLREHGLDAQSRLSFTDPYGRFDGTAADLIGHLNNLSYDRLLMITGIDRLNLWEERDRYGLPYIVTRRGYGGKPLTGSPPIVAQAGDTRTEIPARRAHFAGYPKGCKSNCATMFEMQEVIRRVVLHDALPATERFPITNGDARMFKDALEVHEPKKIARAAAAVLGRGVRHFNKSGSMRGRDNMENAVLLTAAGEWLLVGLSVPWPKSEKSDRPSLDRLDTLANYTLRALGRLGKGKPWLQAAAGDIGVEIEAFLPGEKVGSRPQDVAVLRIVGQGFDRVELYGGQRRLSLETRRGRVRVASLPVPIVVIGYRRGSPAAYRMLALVED